MPKTNLARREVNYLSSSDEDLHQDGEGSASSEDEEFKANFDLPLD